MEALPNQEENNEIFSNSDIEPIDPEEAKTGHYSVTKNQGENKITKNWRSALADDDEADDLLSGCGSDDLDVDWHSPLADDDEADDFNSNL